MDIHPETIISETSSNRITTRTRITGVQRFQVPNGDDLTGSAETLAYLLVQVDRIRRWILQPCPIDTKDIHVNPLLQFPLNIRRWILQPCPIDIKGYLHQQLQSLLLQDTIPQDFWNEFIDTLTSNFKTILSDYSVTTRRKSGEVEILHVDVEVVNEECYNNQRFREHMSLLDAAAADDDDYDYDYDYDNDDDDGGDQSCRETPASQGTVNALKTMTYEESRYVTGSGCCDGDHAYDESSHGCSICLNKYLNASMIKWMPCSHVFHSECIEGWLKKKNTCPLCRFKMPTSKP